jgi:hypothetical protein
MQQQQTPSVVQPILPKTPIAPAAKSAPLPLDPNLFRQVGGGTLPHSGPGGGW